MWFGFVPLFLVLYEESNLKKIFFYGFLTGVIFYLTSLYWLCNVKPMGIFAYVAWVALSLYLSLFLGTSMLAAAFLKKRYNVNFLLSVPLVFTVFEYVREWLFSGFPLQTPAQSQAIFLPFIRILKITGISGANFIIYFLNIFLTCAIFRKKTELSKNNVIVLSIILLILFASLGFSNVKQKCDYKELKASILQPDINQDVIEWTGNFRDNTLKIFREMVLKLKDENPDIIIWPETGYPGVLNYEPWRAKEIAEWLKRPWHIIGSDKMEITKENERKYYNTAFLIDENGTIRGEYSKYHLVPFGEYVPLQDVFPFIKKVVRRYGYEGFTRGKTIEPLIYKDVKFGTLICYDSLFPEISREFVKKGAVFLVHLSYETWYGKTPATAQIFQNTCLRAIENEVPLVRCVASGISGFADSDGRIYSKSKLFTKDVLTGKITYKQKHKPAFYTKYGDWFVFLTLIMLVILVVINRKKKNDSINN
jgi:apolipoprotein N-acyltransferase